LEYLFLMYVRGFATRELWNVCRVRRVFLAARRKVEDKDAVEIARPLLDELQLLNRAHALDNSSSSLDEDLGTNEEDLGWTSDTSRNS
jgi:hypothetical protein